MVIVHHGLFPQRAAQDASRPAEAPGRHHLPLHHRRWTHIRRWEQRAAGARIDATPGTFGGVGLACGWPLSIEELVDRVGAAVARPPLVLPYGPREIRRLAISTGAAGYDLIQAAHEGFDALLTGEPEEPNYASARELGIHLIAAGHHATERYCVQALAAHLAERFGLDWRYVEADNPI
jgi:putative NIF3 family GTP cyclohydrolase 1 type 2